MTTREKTRVFVTVVVLVLLPGCMGCTEKVPPGYVGMIMTPNGLEGKVLQSGCHTCYNRDRLVLLETSEATNTEPLSVLCADDLNFKCDIKVRCRTRTLDAQSMKDVFKRQGSKAKWEKAVGKLGFEWLYSIYIQPEARSIGRQVVSKYQTTEIRKNREAIQKKIRELLDVASKGTPLEITSVVASNFDYPEVITKAVEKKRKKEIEIEEERATQAMKLLQAENRLKIAEKMKIVKVAEAEAEAASIDIFSKVLTPNYLKWKEIDAQKALYERVGAGDKVIITSGESPSALLNID